MREKYYQFLWAKYDCPRTLCLLDKCLCRMYIGLPIWKKIRRTVQSQTFYYRRTDVQTDVAAISHVIFIFLRKERLKVLLLTKV